jgi:hypothetical protein
VDPLGVPAPVWVALSLVVAAFYLVVSPRPAGTTSELTGWQRVVLRWSHGVAWLVVAAAFSVSLASTAAARPLFALAGLIYALFFVTVARTGARRRG